MTAPGAIIVGGYANGVSALRGLARAGVRTAVILTKSHDIAHHSRYAHEAHRVLDLQERPDGLIELLQRQAQSWRGWAIIPTNDHALTALAQHRELLSRWYRVAVPDQEIVRRVVDKAETYRLAREVGVDIPRSYGLASQMTDTREDIIYPVVVKPLESALFWERFGKKLIVASNRAELMAAVAQMRVAGIEAEVLDLIPGSDGRFFNYTVDAAAIPPVFNQDDAQQVKGATIGALGYINPQWQVLASLGYLDTQQISQNPINNGNRLTLTPEWSGSLWTTYDLPKGLTFGGGVRFVDEVFINTANTIVAPGFALVDAMAEYDINAHLTLRLNITNLTDKVYIKNVNNNGGRYNPGTPRAATITSSVRF